MHHWLLAVAPGWRPLAAWTLALAGLTPGYAQPYDAPLPGSRYQERRAADAPSGYRRGEETVVRCESAGDYRHCRADTGGGVRLYRQLSNSACRYNDTWGYDRRGVWVDNGCRAEFTLD